MEFQDIINAHLLRIELDQSMMYASLYISSEDGVNGRIDVISLNGLLIRMQIHRLSLRSGLSTVKGTPCLGEIEAFSLEEDRLMIDGDFGCIEFIAGRFDIGTIR